MAKIYYETDSLENLRPLLDAFAHYLKTIKSADQIIIRRNINFIKYLKKLIRLKEKNTDQSETDQLKDNIKKVNISEMRWLMKKISDLSISQTGQKSGAG